jgi:hypothetical protein
MTIQAGVTNCVFTSPPIAIYGNILISATGASYGSFEMYGVGSHTINIASGHSFDFNSGINMLGGGTYTLAANLNLTGGGASGYLYLRQGTFNMSTFTITNYGSVGTDTVGGSYSGTATFNATAAITQGTGIGELRFIRGNVNLNAVAITCNTCQFGQNDINSDLAVTTSAGQTITCATSFLFSLGKAATNQTLRTVNGAMTSFTTLIRTGTTLNITALTFTAGVEPTLSINGDDVTGVTNITTITTSGIVGDDNSSCVVYSGKLTGGAVTIGAFRIFSEVALTGTLTINTVLNGGGNASPLVVSTISGVPVSFAAITIPRQTATAAYPAIFTSLGGNLTVTGAITIGDAVNGRAGIDLESYPGVGTPPVVNCAAITAGYILAYYYLGAVTFGATTLTSTYGSGYALYLESNGNATITSISTTAAQPSTTNNVFIRAYSGNISISGTTDVGPAGGKGSAEFLADTGSVSHGAITCADLNIVALTTVSQGAITITYPFPSISGPVVSVQTGGNITTAAITADFNIDATSNYLYANYSTTAGGNISFGGTVTLGTTTYRKGLIAAVSGGSGTISYVAVNASFVNLTTPGNITGTGTVTLSCADVINVVPNQFLLDVGGTATNTAATTAVATTGVAAGIGTKFRVQGAGSVSFTNQITGNVGALDFEFANTGTVSCAAITGGRLFSVVNGNNATFGAISGTEFDSGNTGTLTTGAITMAVGAFGEDGTVNIASTGTATLNGALSCVGFYRYQGNLTLGAFTYAATQYFDIDPGFTFVRSTSTISIGNASAGDISFGHGGYTYNIVNMTGRLGRIGSNVSGTGVTAVTFAFTGVANPHARAIFYGDLTVTAATAGALSLVGNSLVNRLSVESYIAGTPITMAGSARTLTNVDFTDISASTLWTVGTSVGDCGGNNANLLGSCTPAQPRTAIASGNWDNTATWSGGVLPLGQDPVTISSAVTLTVNNRRVLGNSIDMTGSSATISFAGNTYPYALVCGAVTIPSTVTIDAGGVAPTLVLSTRTNKVYTYAPASSGEVTLSLYAPNTVVTQLNNLTAYGLAVEAGTWNTQTGGNVPDYPVTAPFVTAGYMYSGGTGADPVAFGMAPSYAGVIKLKCNSSLITYRNTFITYSAATLEANTSTIKASSLTSTFSSLTHYGSGSFYNLAVEATVVSSGVRVFNNIVVTNSIVVPTTSTQPTTIRSNNIPSTPRRGIDMTGAVTPFVINTPRYIIFQDLDITLTPQVTTTLAKYKRVTITGTTLRAYGLADLGANVNIDFVSALKTAVYSAINATYAVPNVTELLITVVGGGGQAGKPLTANEGAGGGGGGGVAILEAFGTVTPNSTIYVNAASPSGAKTVGGSGSTGNSSWVNLTANSAPLSSAQGALATGGNGGAQNFTGAQASGGNGVYGTDFYSGGGGGTGGGTANFLSVGYNGSAAEGGGGAGTNFSGLVKDGGGGISGPLSGGAGGSNSARTPTAGGAGTNGGGGGGGGNVLQVRTSNQPASRPNGSSLCTINATSHGLLDGETANITFGFKTGSYSTGSFSSATATRNNGSTTLSVTTTSNHNLTTNDVINLTSRTFKFGTYTTGSLTSNSITRANGSTTCTVVTTTSHGLTNGDTIRLEPAFRSGTYSRSGTLVTCNVTSHGLTNGQTYYIDFTSGSALDGSYVVTVVTANQFRVTTAASGTTSGNVTIGGSTQLTTQNYTVTVTNSTTFTITTAQSTGIFTTANSTVRTPIATCSVTSHGFTNGQTYYLDFTSGSGPDGSYVVTVLNANSFTVNLVTTPFTSGNVTLGGSSQLSTGNYTVTVTGLTTFTITTAQNTGVISTVAGTTPFATFNVTSHGLTTGQTYYLDFTSGTGPDGSYVITSTGTNSFTTTLVTTPGASGNVTIGGSSQLTNGDYVVSVITSNQFTITTIQTTGVASATATSVLVNSTVVGGAGGAGADYNSVSYSLYNNTPGIGTIGLGGAGGAGGSAGLTSGFTPNYGKGGVGANGGIGAGGGGGGSFGSSNPSSDAGNGGSGGAGLVIITYAAPRSVSRTAFIV